MSIRPGLGITHFPFAEIRDFFDWVELCATIDFLSNGRDLKPLLCVGDAQHLIQRINAYVAAGAEKFVLFPIAKGRQDMFAQTEKLVNEALPAIER